MSEKENYEQCARILKALIHAGLARGSGVALCRLRELCGVGATDGFSDNVRVLLNTGAVVQCMNLDGLKLSGTAGWLLEYFADFAVKAMDLRHQSASEFEDDLLTGNPIYELPAGKSKVAVPPDRDEETSRWVAEKLRPEIAAGYEELKRKKRDDDGSGQPSSSGPVAPVR